MLSLDAVPLVRSDRGGRCHWSGRFTLCEVMASQRACLARGRTAMARELKDNSTVQARSFKMENRVGRLLDGKIAELNCWVR